MEKITIIERIFRGTVLFIISFIIGLLFISIFCIPLYLLTNLINLFIIKILLSILISYSLLVFFYGLIFACLPDWMYYLLEALFDK